MNATVLSFFRPAPTTVGDWSQQELAEFYRVEAASMQSGLRLSLERGLSDEGDPWLVFCREDGDVFLHFARVDGSYVICSDMIAKPLFGPDFRALLAELVQQNPSVLPLPRSGANGNAGRPGAQILMHPAALLAAIVATTCLFSTMNEAVAGELDTGSAVSSSPAGVQASDGGSTGSSMTGDGLNSHPTRSRTDHDSEFTLITAVILACIMTFADSWFTTGGSPASLLLGRADTGQTTEQTASTAVTVPYESAANAQAKAASHGLSAHDTLATLLETGAIMPTHVMLRDMRETSTAPALLTTLAPLVPIYEIVAKASYATEMVGFTAINFRLPISIGLGHSVTVRLGEAANSRERVGLTVDSTVAGSDEVRASGGGVERVAETAHAAPVSSTAIADGGLARVQATAPSAETNAARSQTTTASDSDRPKLASAPAIESNSAALKTTVTTTSTTANDSSAKNITSVFGDVTTLSAKSVSLVLHTLLDALPYTSPKGSSSTPSNEKITTDSSAKTAASNIVSTPSTGLEQAALTKISGQFDVRVLEVASQKTDSSLTLTAFDTGRGNEAASTVGEKAQAALGAVTATSTQTLDGTYPSDGGRLV